MDWNVSDEAEMNAQQLRGDWTAGEFSRFDHLIHETPPMLGPTVPASAQAPEK